MAAIRQWRIAIKDSDIVQSQKATLKDVLPFKVLAIDPPREIE